jgi:Methyltransferase domain
VFAKFAEYTPTIDEALRQAILDLRAGRPIADRIFDQLFPEPVRRVSARFWTPIAVARKAARILAQGKGPVLDVGAGVGKFCIVGALATNAEFHGLEHREDLVAIANGVAKALGLSDRVRVFHGTLDTLEWSQYTSYYFCNPFEENIFPETRRYDDRVELSKTRFQEDTARVERELDAAPVGTRVVTFHGLGARVPATYQRLEEETRGNPLLHAWVKIQEGSAEGRGTFDGWIADHGSSER